MPASCEAYTKSKKDAITLAKELAKRKEMFSTLDIKHKQKRFYRRFPIYDVWGGAYWRGRLLNFFFSRGGGELIGGGTS